MKYPVGTSFRKNGWDMLIVMRAGNVVLVKRTRPDTATVSWEVAILTPYEAHSRFGNVFPAGESYPASEQWGTKGWSYTNKSAALMKLHAVLTLCQQPQSL